MDFWAILVLLFIFGFFGLLLAKFVLLRNPPPDPRADDYDDDLYYHPINLSKSTELDTKVKVVQLFLSCTNLTNKDWFSMSDPHVEAFVRESTTEPWRKFGETEVITDDLNPYFCKGIIIAYFSYKNQQIRFNVKDIDIRTSGEQTISSDPIGESVVSLRDVVQNSALEMDLHDRWGNLGGRLRVIAEEVTGITEDEEGRKSILHFNEVSVQGLPLNYPTYFLIFRLCNNDNRILVYNSEVQKSAFNPRWRSFAIRERNPNTTFIISLWKFNPSSIKSNTLIGEFTITIEQLLARSSDKLPFSVLDKQTRHEVARLSITCQRDKKPIPEFKVASRRGAYTQYLNRYSFNDYCKHGLEIKTICALDMTTSSAHFHERKGNQPSIMEQILRHFVKILAPLDMDQEFPFFGFGGRDDLGNVLPFFPLNGNPEKPECHGGESLIQCYLENHGKFTLGSMADVQEKKYSKNDFHQLVSYTVDQVMAERAKGMSGHKYFILFVVITGDDINLKETINLLIGLTEFPISVILVALGDRKSFPKTISLDADESPLIGDENRKAKRDQVQVVPINPQELLNNTLSSDYLTREVLAEVPIQVCSYFAMNSVSPRNL